MRSMWRFVEWALFVLWVADAALVMAHIRAGFFTNYAADFAIPAWIYVVQRRMQSTPGAKGALRRLSPGVLAMLIFLCCLITEVCQFFWPRGLFPGVFDWFDVLAYSAATASFWALDHKWPIDRQAPTGPDEAKFQASQPLD